MPSISQRLVFDVVISIFQKQLLTILEELARWSGTRSVHMPDFREPSNGECSEFARLIDGRKGAPDGRRRDRYFDGDPRRLGACGRVSTQPTLRLQKSAVRLFSDLVERQRDGSPVAHVFLLAVRLLPAFTSDFTT